MKLLIAKYAITAFIIVLVSELAKRSDRIGALVSSLPIVTIMVLLWLYFEGQGSERLASHSLYTFWYVIPSLPMFLLIPALLNYGFSFWLSLGLGVVTSLVSFLLVGLLARLFGVELLP